MRERKIMLFAKFMVAFSLLFTMVPTASAATSASPPSAVVHGFPSLQQAYSLSCEYAAAAAVTLYWGRTVTQREFISKIGTNPNPHVGFRGNINADWGGTRNYGVYAEPLAPVLEAHGYNVDVFYGGVSRLKSELAAGHPVVIWYAGRSGSLPETYQTYDGDRFKLVPYEHAVVAYGYDSDGIWIMDVGDGGKYYYGWSSFLHRWDYFDEMALVMTPGWND